MTVYLCMLVHFDSRGFLGAKPLVNNTAKLEKDKKSKMNLVSKTYLSLNTNQT